MSLSRRPLVGSRVHPRLGEFQKVTVRYQGSRPFRVIRRILSHRNKESSQYCPLSLPASHLQTSAQRVRRDRLGKSSGKKDGRPPSDGHPLCHCAVSEAHSTRHAPLPKHVSKWGSLANSEVSVLFLVHVLSPASSWRKRTMGYRYLACIVALWCGRCHLPRSATPAKIAAPAGSPCHLSAVEAGLKGSDARGWDSGWIILRSSRLAPRVHPGARRIPCNALKHGSPAATKLPYSRPYILPPGKYRNIAPTHSQPPATSLARSTVL